MDDTQRQLTALTLTVAALQGTVTAGFANVQLVGDERHGENRSRLVEFRERLIEIERLQRVTNGRVAKHDAQIESLEKDADNAQQNLEDKEFEAQALTPSKAKWIVTAFVAGSSLAYWVLVNLAGFHR